MQSNKVKQGEGLARLREALGEVFELIALKKAQEAALAAAAPAPPRPDCDHGNATSASLDTCRMTRECRDRNPLYCAACGNCENEGHDKTCPDPKEFTTPPPQGPSNLKVGDEVWLRAKVMQFIEPEHNGVEILLEIGRNELMRTWCNASDLRRMEMTLLGGKL